MISIKNFTYSYPHAKKPAVEEISLEVGDGEVLLLTGSSGSGKSTLLKALCGVIPRSTGGEISGSIAIGARTSPFNKKSHCVGYISYVSQNPNETFISEYVEEELAFAPINLGWDRQKIKERIDYCSTLFGIDHLRSRHISTLSGGEAHKVAIASALTCAPSYLLLDEPTSSLDVGSRHELLTALEDIRKREALSIVIAEHRIEGLSGFVTSTYSFDSPDEISFHGSLQRRGKTIARAENLTYSYAGKEIFSPLTFQCQQGVMTTLVGPNGSGKSTALKIAAGLLPSTHFTIEGESPKKTSREKIGYVPQNPSDLFLFQSVREELHNSSHAIEILRTLNSAISLESHPRDLSEGEKLSLSLAIALEKEPVLLILDEPTRGLDARNKSALIAILAETKAAVLMATHESDLISDLPSHIIEMRSRS